MHVRKRAGAKSSLVAHSLVTSRIYLRKVRLGTRLSGAIFKCQRLKIIIHISIPTMTQAGADPVGVERVRGPFKFFVVCLYFGISLYSLFHSHHGLLHMNSIWTRAIQIVKSYKTNFLLLYILQTNIANLTVSATPLTRILDQPL